MDTIEIIQGDSKNVIVFVEEGADLIETLWFTCSELGIKKQLSKIDDTHYMVNFTKQETREYKACVTTYDITTDIDDDQRYTSKRDKILKILKKDNPVDD